MVFKWDGDVLPPLLLLLVSSVLSVLLDYPRCRDPASVSLSTSLRESTRFEIFDSSLELGLKN